MQTSEKEVKLVAHTFKMSLKFPPPMTSNNSQIIVEERACFRLPRQIKALSLPWYGAHTSFLFFPSFIYIFDT